MHGKAERKEWTDLQCMTHLIPVDQKPPVLPKIIATVNFCGYTNNMGKYKPNKCSVCDISDRKQWALGQTFVDSDRSISGIITAAFYIPVRTLSQLMSYLWQLLWHCSSLDRSCLCWEYSTHISLGHQAGAFGWSAGPCPLNPAPLLPPHSSHVPGTGRKGNPCPWWTRLPSAFRQHHP